MNETLSARLEFEREFGLAANVRFVALGERVEVSPGIISVYEDRWMHFRELVRARLLAHEHQFRSIFARNCTVVKISAAEASDFLEKYHVYGSARCKFRYGLKAGEELVAVSTFSAPRPMPRMVDGSQVEVQSYEWVRFASLPHCRIPGGMGKLLQAFIDDAHPQDIMSYADREWSEGDVYLKLGFKRVAELPPMDFYVDTTTWQRFSCKKYGHDIPEGCVAISNLGSVKYVLTLL